MKNPISIIKQRFPATKKFSLARTKAGALVRSGSPFSRKGRQSVSLATVKRDEHPLEKSLMEFNALNVELVDRMGAAVPPFDPYMLLALVDSSGYLSNGMGWKATSTVGQGFTADPELLMHLDMANEEDTFQDVLDQFAADVDIYGYAFIEVLKRENTALFYNMAALRTRVQPIKGTDFRRYIHYDYGFGLLLWKEHDAFDEGDHTGVRMFKLSSRRGNRFYGDPDYISAKLPLMLNVSNLKLAEKFFENSMMGDKAIIFKGPEYSPEEIDEMTAYLTETMTGLDNAHKMLMLQIGPNEDVEIKDLNTELKDTSFTALRSANKEEIAAANRVPLPLVGISTAMKLGGGGEIDSAMKMLKVGFADHRQRKYEAWWQNLFRDAGLPKWNTFKLKPLDSRAGESDIPNLATAVDHGIYTAEEARTLLDTEKRVRLQKIGVGRMVTRELLQQLLAVREELRKDLGNE